MRAGQKGEAAVMLDDAVVVLGKAEFFERVVEGAARGHQQHRHVQPASGLCGLCRFLLVGHEVSSPGRQPSWLSPRRLILTSRWMPMFITRPNPSIIVIMAGSPPENNGRGTPAHRDHPHHHTRM